MCRLGAGAPVPPLPEGAPFACVARTPEEVSVVVPEQHAPPAAQIDGGWRLLRVDGPLDLTLTGVLASLATPLADAGVPLFAVATFDTDWLLVPGGRVDDALAALRTAGHVVRT